MDKPPPRHVDDPLVATNPYAARKIECQELSQASGLTWRIFRLADVPILGSRDPHPIMFEIGLDNRIETLHADDAGLAIANALETSAVRGRVLFIGGERRASWPTGMTSPGCWPRWESTSPGRGVQPGGLRHGLDRPGRE